MATIGPLFKEHAEYITAILKMLDDSDTEIPENKEFYFDVELKNSLNETVARFYNEIGPGAWCIDFVI